MLKQFLTLTSTYENLAADMIKVLCVLRLRYQRTIQQEIFFIIEI